MELFQSLGFKENPFSRFSSEKEIIYLGGIFYEPKYYSTIFQDIINNNSRYVFGGRADDFMEEILKINNSIKKAYVTDIGAFSERSKNPKIEFIIQPSLFETPFQKNELDNIILSLILHHMNNSDQELFIKHLSSILKEGGRLILIEEGYPENYNSVNLSENIKRFLSFDKIIKMKIISFYDWFGNKIMRNRDNIALTYNYKTKEEWEEIFSSFGLNLFYFDFVGSCPKDLDLYPPKIIMVFEKIRRNKI